MPGKWVSLALLAALVQGCHTMAPIRSARLAPEGATVHSSSALVDNRGHLGLRWGERNGTPYFDMFAGITRTPTESYVAGVDLGPSANGHQGVLMGMGPNWDLGVDVGGDISLALVLRRALKRDPLEKGLAVTTSVEGRSSLSSRHVALGLAATQRLGSRLDLTLGGRGGYLYARWQAVDKTGMVDLAKLEGPFVESYAEAELQWGRLGWAVGAILRWPLADIQPLGPISELGLPPLGLQPWIGYSFTVRWLPRPGVPDRLVQKSGYRLHASAEAVPVHARYELANRLLRAGLWKDAADELYRCLDSEPESPQFHGALALVFENGNERELARFHALRALAVEPDNAVWKSLAARLGI